MLTLVQHPGSAGISVSLRYFPVGGSAPACQARYDVPAVNLAPLPDSAPSIVASLDSTLPMGLAPTGPALQGAMNSAKARADYATKLVLITAGPPTECVPLDFSGLAGIARDGFNSTPIVITDVIGLGLDVEPLAQIADAGGGEAFAITAASAREELVRALFTIAERHVPCTIVVPPPPQDEWLDPGLVAVGYGAWGSTDAAEVPKLSQRSDCDLRSGEGWYFDDAEARTVHLCPGTCDEVQGGWLTLSLGCPPSERALVS